MKNRRRALSVVAFNLALLPWSVGSVVWAAKVTPKEDREVRALLVSPLKYFWTPPGIRHSITIALEDPSRFKDIDELEQTLRKIASAIEDMRERLQVLNTS
jgi:hypothetical protein